MPDSRNNRNDDKLLFTPGPLTTSATVKAAMLHDLGSRDGSFKRLVADIRERLLEIASVSQDDGYEAILMQGAGTFGLEAVLGSAVPPRGNVMVMVNGSYGDRMLTMADRLGIRTTVYRKPENEIHDVEDFERRLAQSRAVTNVHVVHCETTTGILNPIQEFGPIAKRYGKIFSVDAMSSFGALPVDIEGWGIDYLVTSANKALEGVPGFSVVVAKREALEASEGWARSLSLDLFDQWQGLEKNGQFRFTPPTHTMLAFKQALDEFVEEGGVLGRGMRYHNNQSRLVEGMRNLGIATYLPDELQSHVITTFRYPDHPNFDFDALHERLSERGFVIYPGKISKEDVFRVGSIGRLYPEDVDALLVQLAEVLEDMGVTTSQPV